MEHFTAKIERLLHFSTKIELYRDEIQLLVLCSAKIQLFSGLGQPTHRPTCFPLFTMLWTTWPPVTLLAAIFTLPFAEFQLQDIKILFRL